MGALMDEIKTLAQLITEATITVSPPDDSCVLSCKWDKYFCQY